MKHQSKKTLVVYPRLARYFAVFTVLVWAVGCNGRAVQESKSIVGSWKVIAMQRSPIDLEKVVENELIGGSMTFKPDGTFNAEINYPKFPDKTVRTSGTYSIENETVSISNAGNDSTTKSTFRFEKGFLIITPENPEGFTAYLKPLI